VTPRLFFRALLEARGGGEVLDNVRLRLWRLLARADTRAAESIGKQQLLYTNCLIRLD